VFMVCPLVGVPEEAAATVRAAVERAANGRRLIVTVEAPAGVGPELNLLAAMDQVVVMEASAIVAVGTPAEALKPSPRCVVVAARRTPALVTALTERGLRVEQAEDAGAESGRLVVHLTEGATTNNSV